MNPYYDDLAVRANHSTRIASLQHSAQSVRRVQEAHAIARPGRPGLPSLRSVARRLPFLGSRRGLGGYVAHEPRAGRVPWGTGASV